MNEVELQNKLNLTIEEAAQSSNIGTIKIRELTKDKSCISFILKVGNKTLIKRKAFEAWLNNQYYI